ncbi:hypothetical protein SBOR_3315 [Sclerotinia borealis F-4128]|uniref:Protein kinase domain-containing protein n=1 Tax=Sclerotinia borealis (strain F-4128) TaxID=1432307 RepID=W9CP35_SCLBF|nr:hypothetical protein SBOR_3315 [Sclerotinia borealis F-4128]
MSFFKFLRVLRSPSPPVPPPPSSALRLPSPSDPLLVPSPTLFTDDEPTMFTDDELYGPLLKAIAIAIYPEGFLPSTVILKKRKPDWDEEFETEKRMYRHLAPLQGTVIPHYYGEAVYDGSPALVLSDIGGEILEDDSIIKCRHDHNSLPQSGDDDDLDILEAKLKEAFKMLTTYGVIHEDTQLHNIFVVDDRVMVIDLEQASVSDNIWDSNFNSGSVNNTNNASVRNIIREIKARRWGTRFIMERERRSYREATEQNLWKPLVVPDIPAY